jgi:hypothetical protein
MVCTARAGTDMPASKCRAWKDWLHAPDAAAQQAMAVEELPYPPLGQ